ncbi:MAG TPA: prephenate dehydrogenase/arogenate dehydrogenase family protein [Candidatus Flavonifractor intestinipullorum]|uniref:Prephenate dehydrogenase/arogenate dehydrogenase family protein n=1 Tax=Candidatus Flavonifractor intestinipullorum TaxID=2838587 RepID=A0A9D2S5Y5_9FIRM|nr:prephenate dehydrogenase/arogenate dehydrogenase family protein [Candidatus Flavonifractor intestinipullorum]
MAEKKRLVVVGLGLIGGSLAMALKGFEDYEIVGVDISEPTLRYAAEHGVGDMVTGDAAGVLPGADVVVLALHPRGIVRFLQEHRERFRPGCLVTDVCGVKTAILEGARVLPEGVDFIGCHPMAGTEFSGIEHAFPELFQGSHWILVPRENSTDGHIALLERLAGHIGCRDVYRTTAQEHDAMIAYTSQLMHIIAVSVCDDPMLFACRGFEGSSFRGCTRVAALDVGLWTELFSMNRPALSAALDRLIGHLTAYREALDREDPKALAEKLSVSAARKRKMDLPGPDLLE